MALQFALEDIALHFSNVVMKRHNRLAACDLPEGKLNFSYRVPLFSHEYGLGVELQFGKKQTDRSSPTVGYGSEKLGFGSFDQVQLLNMVHEQLGSHTRFDYWTPSGNFKIGSFTGENDIHGEITNGSDGLKIEYDIPLTFVEQKPLIEAVVEFQEKLRYFFGLTGDFINNLYDKAGLKFSRTLVLEASKERQELHVVEHRLQANTSQGLDALIEVQESPLEEITWDQVGGMGKLKQQLSNVAKAIKAGLYTQYGTEPKTGYIFLGDSGNGKTYLAKAFAFNAGLAFYELTMSDLRKPLVGAAEAQIAAVHREAFKRPSIIFIDEIDGFATMNTLVSNNSAPQAALRSWMSRAASNSTPVIYIATTTKDKVDLIDPQFLRPGRLTEHVYLENPDLDERQQILQVHIDGVVSKTKIRLFDNLDLRTIANSLDGKTRAKVAENVKGVVEQLIHYHLNTGSQRAPVNTKDFVHYLKNGSLPPPGLGLVDIA